MDLQQLTSYLSQFSTARIGVMGDYCVDAYWTLDEGEREISIETGKPTHAVRSQRYSLGGAGNIVANLAALDVGKISAFGVVGNDLFGREMLNLLDQLNVDYKGMIRQDTHWDTAVYTKPHLANIEQERIDFGRYNVLAQSTADALIRELNAALSDLDLIILNRQLAKGVYARTVLDAVINLASTHQTCQFLMDFRNLPDQFPQMIVKLNAGEAARYCSGESAGAQVSQTDTRSYAHMISDHSGKPVIITRGDRGIITFDGKGFTEVPGLQIVKPIDPVGAGDTTVAALGACLASHISLGAAAEIANFAASVTIQKLRQTGTATPKEILIVGGDPDYRFRPELAAHTRQARYLEHSHIEIANPDWKRAKISHVIFDHDGTISVLRQGWEVIMEPVMIQAIFGAAIHTIDEAAYQQVVKQVRSYISTSTGIQTILQMQALVEMVRQAGYVEETAILDAAGYKALYNQALMEEVNQRTMRVKKKELGIEDVTIKGAVEMLHALKDRGVTLYLASGTDEPDVKAEANLLGYGDLFDGGIFGAVGDVSKYSKKMVIDRIIHEHNLKGPQLLTFGDGPVEIRETQKRGGITVGIASDEVRRYGLDTEKRTRLIEAGADIIISDFSQREKLIDYLFGIP